MSTIARNIGPHGRRSRLLAGLVVLAIGLLAAAALVLGGVARGARLALFLPFLGGALSLLQARDHT